jgi:putative aminopeptidase FrvX
MNMDKTELLLKELTEASGVAGYEQGARAVMRKYLAPLGDLSQDRLGSIICKHAGKAEAPRIMLAAHMDEIGFMVKFITKEGFLRFVTLGGWPIGNMLGHRVAIETNKGRVIGCLTGKPPYMATPEERKKPLEHRDMYIDIGASSAEEVEAAGVRIGDPVIPVSEFTVLGNPARAYMAKAFDDRIGCAAIIGILAGLKSAHPNAVYGVATVQEEVGVRGATTSAEAVNPDVAVILDVSIVGDEPGIKPEECNNCIGKGPALVNYDPHMIPNLRLRDLVIETAGRLKVPLQQVTMEFGGYDGGPIHLHRAGVPTVVIGLPTRHVHSHNSILRRDDLDNAVKLVTGLIARLDKATVAGLQPG